MRVMGNLVKVNYLDSKETDAEAEIELAPVDREKLKIGDIILVSKIIPSNEPIKNFLNRHNEIVYVIPYIDIVPKKVELPEKLEVMVNEGNDTAVIVGTINRLIDYLKQKE